MSILNLLKNNANFGLEGKIATLWFDQLLLGTGRNKIERVLEMVAEEEKWDKDTLKEIKKIQISTEDILPEFKFLDTSVVDDDEFSIMKGIMETRYKEELSNRETYGGAMHEVLLTSLGVTNSIKYWTVLNSIVNCTFLPMAEEQELISKVFGSMMQKNYADFNNIITAVIPNLAEYSWNEIIEIRNHNYWSNFRNKITELSTSCCVQLKREILDEIVNKDLVEMVQHFRPSVTKNVIKGVACNAPLPIPVNPLSIVCTGYDILKEINFEKKYGWMYFYLDNKKI